MIHHKRCASTYPVWESNAVWRRPPSLFSLIFLGGEGGRGGGRGGYPAEDHPFVAKCIWNYNFLPPLFSQYTQNFGKSGPVQL